MQRGKIAGIGLSLLLALGGVASVACDEAREAGNELEQEVENGEGGEGEGEGGDD